jgi:hypothetical protein
MNCQFVFDLIEAVMVRKGSRKEYRPQALSKSLWSGMGQRRSSRPDTRMSGFLQ